METEKTKRRDYALITCCYFIWGFQPLYFRLNTDIEGLFLLMSRIVWVCIWESALLFFRGWGK